MKQLTISLILIMFMLPTSAQHTRKVTIKGKINDTLTYNWLAGATVTCLNAKDSSKVALVFTDKNGVFIFDSLDLKDYLLYVTYLGFKSITYQVKNQQAHAIIDLGTISMTRVGLALAQVEIIESKNPLKILQDTLEFNRDFFKVRENSTIEEVLKKVPGIQIDNDGSIRINGETVKTILINGRPLFDGENPKIISRNLQADIIDKIQLIDRSPNQRESNGINDPSSDKVINLTIKKTMQNTISGELTTAYGTSGRFGTKLNASRFNTNQQFLLLSSGDNVNGALDAPSYVGGAAQRNWNTGFSYNQELNKKLTISGNYYMHNLKSDLQRTSLRLNILNDTSMYTTQNDLNETSSDNHAISLKLEFRLDSLQKITFSSQASLSKVTSNIKSDYESTDTKFNVINSGIISNIDENNANSISNGLRYEKAFQRKGRLLDLWINYGRRVGKFQEFNVSNNSYTTENGETIGDTINQNIYKNTSNKQLFLLINYTEPVAKNGSLTFSFAEDRMQEESQRTVFDYNNNTKLYDILNANLSNKFKISPIQHYAKIGWVFQKDKLQYSVSFATLIYNIQSITANSSDNLSRQTTTFLPELLLTYSMGKGGKLRFSYRRTPQFPQISQLQPVLDNSDPLHLKIGNSSLKPIDVNSITATYSYINPRTLSSLSFSINSRLVSNQIVNTSRFDSIGRQVIQPLNVDGGYINSIDIESILPLKNRNNSFRLNTKGIIKRDINYSDSTKIISNISTLTQSISYNYSDKDLFDFSVSGSVTYNSLHYPNQIMMNSNYISGGIITTENLTVLYGITIGTNLNYGWVGGRMTGYNSNAFVLNASISKTLFSKKQGLIKLQGFDLLRRNSNVVRIVQDNYIEDTRTNVLKSFFLLKFSYFLGKKE